jgi:hypothetical protein
MYRQDRVDPVRIAGSAIGFVVLVFGYKFLVANGHLVETATTLSIFVLVFGAVIWATRNLPEHRLITVLAIIAAVMVKPGQNADVFVERSFFGTVRVTATPDGQHRLMMHGTTAHGAERVRTPDGAATSEPVPSTYYYSGSPKHRSIVLMREQAEAAGHALKVGVVGLGAGSLGCYSREGETWRMFELDPLVVRVAQDEKLFRFMTRCLPGNEVVIGDARLTLAQEPSHAMDLLIVDAFSSDAIPAHLLTREAIELYLSKVSDGGLIGIHITNRHLELGPALAATARTIPGLQVFSVKSRPREAGYDTAPAHVVFLTRNAAIAGKISAWPDAKPLTAGDGAPWTDDYSDLLSAILHRLRD